MWDYLKMIIACRNHFQFVLHLFMQNNALKILSYESDLNFLSNDTKFYSVGIMIGNKLVGEIEKWMDTLLRLDKWLFTSCNDIYLLFIIQWKRNT